MSIASQISRLQSAKASLKTAIENKGVTVPSSALIDTYDDYVAEISGGGGGGTCYFETDDPYTASTFGSHSIKSITIPSGVTSIEANAFDDYSSLSSVTIPNSVTSIGGGAFSRCSSLSSVTIPSGVTSIGSNAFDRCSSLSSVTIPNSVTIIQPNTFKSCSRLSSVTLPSGLTSIGNSAFTSCSSLSSVTIPNSVTSIGVNTFQSCTSLSSVTLPSGLTSIGNSAFQSCSSLSSVTIPSGVTSIGGNAFRSCSSLSSVTIPSGVTSIENGVFWDSGLETITLPSGVISIGSAAFMGCNKLTSFTCLSINPPALAYNALTISNNCPIYVPAESVDAYKAAPNWSAIKNRIQAIPSPSSQQWVSVSSGDNIPSGTVYDLRISSATTINEDDSIMIEDNETFISFGNLCEAECTEYDEETEECMNAECTGHYTLGWGITDLGSGITDPINPLTFGSDGYWYYNAATGMNGFESDGEAYYAPFDIQVLMDV